MIHEVTGCRDCPMCNIDSEFPTTCMHPSSTESPDIEYENYEGEGSPEWCPIKLDDITIKIKK